jgi:hypothetical protein
MYDSINLSVLELVLFSGTLEADDERKGPRR